MSVEHSLNLKRIFNNPKLNFFIIANLVLFIGCYNLLNNDVKNGISTFISYPIVLFFAVSICLFVGHYNMMLAIILIVALFIILYPSLEPKEEDSVREGFSGARTSYSQRKEERNKAKAVQERRQNRNNETFKDVKNNFSSIYEEMKGEYEDDIKQGMKENLRDILGTKKKENMKNIKKERNKENFDDDIETNYIIRNRKREQFRTVKKRKFNPNDEDDANFLICKEILKDLLNRLTYEYESKDYLKKYVEHRIEEMVDLFHFADDEN